MSLNNIISSSLMINASHMHKMHNPASVIMAIACLEYRGIDRMLIENSFIYFFIGINYRERLAIFIFIIQFIFLFHKIVQFNGLLLHG